MSVNIVVNTMGLKPNVVRQFRRHDVEEISVLDINGMTIAIVWECTDMEVAEDQAEFLWSGMIGARIVKDEIEEIAFVREIGSFVTNGY